MYITAVVMTSALCLLLAGMVGVALPGRRKRRRIVFLAATHTGGYHVEGKDKNRTRVRCDWAQRFALLTPAEFTRRYRLNKENFNKLLGLIGADITPKRKRSDGITAEIKLACTLRYLAGGSYLDIADLHGVEARSTFYKIVWETIGAINDCADLDLPLMAEDGGMLEHISRLKPLAFAYANKVGVRDWSKDPNTWGCIGAVDGLAIKIGKPPSCASHYYSRKGFYSLVRARARC